MVDEFRKYVDKFDFSDKAIALKYYHSLRVKSLCVLIAKDLKLSEEDVKLAEIIGLLHDYGRFMQWNKFHTFNDLISMDHGDYAVFELFDKGKISKYWKKKEDYDVIYDAIKYHNKFSVPKNLPEKNKLFCKIVRDADKLDILYLYVSGSITAREDGKISKQVRENFYNERLVNRKDMKTNADHVLIDLALIYDMNFSYSFRHMKNYKILEQFLEKLKDKDKFVNYVNKNINYLNRKLKTL